MDEHQRHPSLTMGWPDLRIPANCYPTLRSERPLWAQCRRSERQGQLF